MKYTIHKFGGTSVKDSKQITNVYNIVNHILPAGPKGIVVSALKGTTDQLISAVSLAQNQNEKYKEILDELFKRHETEINQLIKSDLKINLIQKIKKDFSDVNEILRSVWILKNATEQIFEQVSGLGEVWSAQIINAYFQEQGQKCHFLDAREILIISKSKGHVLIDWEESQLRLNSWLSLHSNFPLIIITGFVASLASGQFTTLGRNGSDFSASIFGVLFSSPEIFIWTDVDGVLSADPRLVPEAIVLSEMTYQEVSELAYFGAKVVHPATMNPAIIHQIPVWIKNSFNPLYPGTKIFQGAKSEGIVKGFSIIEKMCLINLEGAGLQGVPGVSERLFSALRSANINVVLISQASSEQSICLCIDEQYTGLAKEVITSAFYQEIEKKLIWPIEVHPHVSILAAVGDNLAQAAGAAGQFFSALGRSGINIRCIAQGSSERNISVVIDSADAVKALRVVHSSFILSRQMITIGLIGKGLIGKTFIKQLAAKQIELKTQQKIDFQVRGICDSRQMLTSSEPIDLNNWEKQFSENAVPLNINQFVNHIHSSYVPHSVIIEASASDEIVKHYPHWIEEGIHIISPNKKANTQPYENYLELRNTCHKFQKHFLYSTNVGAGLPIIETLRDLYATGDTIIHLQGILSGTLSYLFNQFDGTQKFSQLVLDAKSKGYTEPDPRDDLSGEDVRRKIVILAREMGQPLNLSDVAIKGLVPADLEKIPLAEFLSRLNELDDELTKKFQNAKQNNKVLRYVAQIFVDGKAEVGLTEVSQDHPFAYTQGADNIVLFKTKRYENRPLVIQGPGAGPEVTAGGVFADLLRLSKYLGGNSL